MTDIVAAFYEHWGDFVPLAFNKEGLCFSSLKGTFLVPSCKEGFFLACSKEGLCSVKPILNWANVSL